MRLRAKPSGEERGRSEGRDTQKRDFLWFKLESTFTLGERRNGDMATQVETLLHNTNTTTPTPLLQDEDLQPPAGHGALTPEPSSEQAGEENSLQENENENVEEKKEFREAPPPKVNPWTKKLNSVTVNGQTAAGEQH